MTSFEFRAAIACFLCNILQKHPPQRHLRAVFILRVQGASVTSKSRRRGAPEVVPGGSLKFPAFAREGEGAKMLSRVPGDIRGHGGPAQHFRDPVRAGRRATALVLDRLGAALHEEKIARSGHCYLRSISSAIAAVDSTKLGGQSLAASLRRRCASFRSFFSRASSPL
jgi:hypothetical protein